jgi:gliding motility-associated-like protein
MMKTKYHIPNKKIIIVCLVMSMLIDHVIGFNRTDAVAPGIITASANNICPGTTVIFSASPTTNASYLWYVNGASVNVTTSTFSGNAFQNNDQVTCYITTSLGAGFSNVITMAVASAQGPSITISATSADICAGTSVTFTATAINGGTSPVYQWKVNGLAMGSNLNTYTTNTLNNNDAVTCTLTSSINCAGPSIVSSYNIIMNVSAMIQPKGKIIATANTVCSGTTTDFSMNMSVGQPVSYQWKINGYNVASGSSFQTANLKDQDVISCDLLANTQCSVNQPFSASFTINVTPVVIPTVNITASATAICPGTSVTFQATPGNAGTNILYQWKINNVNAGTNNAVFTTDALQDNDLVTCEIAPKNLTCLLNSTVVSNTVKIIVYPFPIVSLPATQNIRSGNSITLNPVINGDISQYVWSPAAGLSDASIKNPIASPLNNTTYTLSVISSGGCADTATTTLKVIGGKIVVKNTFTPNADGINDTWEIPDLINHDTCTVDVFNRYGQNVYHSVGYPHAWDASYKGTSLPAGVYYYIIDLKDGTTTLNGPVTIIR